MPDSTFGQADSSQAELSEFFRRPIKIADVAWNVGTNLNLTFNPWVEFFENPRVLNRISNYNLLRCKLHVRFLINGNGFHYGRLIAAYQPQQDFDDLTLFRNTVQQDVIAASQRPHVYLDPTNSQGGTLTLPFFHFLNALRIPFMEWQVMGEVKLKSVNELKHANGGTDPITISMFAWAEEVQLSIPTSVNPSGLVPQAGDEYTEGPISRVANTVSRIANKLTDIPIISPYARATEMASGTVANIASMFGYSRPVTLETSQPFSPHILGNMANTNVKDSSTKLTLDAKQELTVDPRTMGLGSNDEMTVASISQRESYLTTFAWQVSDPVETLLWNSFVSPVLWDTNNSEIHMTASCFATIPFQFWRGTMKFRFQIVASAFHKGRLKIVYDPDIPSSNEYNTNYTYIVDLANERDFTVDVGWGSAQAFLEHASPGVDPVPFSTNPLLPGTLNERNGVISVYVVNDITVPNSTVNNDIEINVFVSTGDDFEVADPDDSIFKDYTLFDPTGAGAGQALLTRPAEETLDEFEKRTSKSNTLLKATLPARTQAKPRLEPQAGEEEQPMNQPDSDNTINESEPMKPMASETMAVTLSPTDPSGCVFFGDPVTSFRQCLKRYNFHSACAIGGNSSRYFVFNNSDFPYYRGYAPGGVDRTDTPLPLTQINYCTTTLLNYLTPAFAARRGGLRWKYMRCQGTDDGPALQTVSRLPQNFVGYDVTEILPSTGNNPYQVADEAARILNHLWSGGLGNDVNQNSALEFELPFYQTWRFIPARLSDMTSSFADFSLFHRYCTLWSKNGADSAYVARFVSTGEDFTLNFFLGAPVMYYVPTEPTPTPGARV